MEAIDVWKQRQRDARARFPDATMIGDALRSVGIPCSAHDARNASGETFGTPRDEISVPINTVLDVFTHHRAWMRIIESRKGKKE